MHLVVRALFTMKIMVPQVLVLFLFGKIGYSDSHPPKLSTQVTLPAGWIDISKGAPVENFTRCEKESNGTLSVNALQQLLQEPIGKMVSFVAVLPREQLVFEVISTKTMTKEIFLSKEKRDINLISQKNISFSGIQVARLEVNAPIKEGVHFHQNVYLAEHRDFILTCTRLDTNKPLNVEKSCDLIVKAWLEQTPPLKRKWVGTIKEKLKEATPLLKIVGIEMIKWMVHHTIHIKK